MAILGPYGFEETHTDDWVCCLLSKCMVKYNIKQLF